MKMWIESFPSSARANGEDRATVLLRRREAERVEQVDIQAGEQGVSAPELFIARLPRGLHFGDEGILNAKVRKDDRQCLDRLLIDCCHRCHSRFGKHTASREL